MLTPENSWLASISRGKDAKGATFRVAMWHPCSSFDRQKARRPLSGLAWWPSDSETDVHNSTGQTDLRSLAVNYTNVSSNCACVQIRDGQAA